MVCLEPVDEPGGPYEIEVFENDAKACTIKDVYAGEIWLAAGGGNMEYPLIRSEFAKFILPKIGKTEIRYYKVPYFGHMEEAQAKAEQEDAAAAKLAEAEAALAEAKRLKEEAEAKLAQAQSAGQTGAEAAGQTAQAQAEAVSQKSNAEE